MVVASGAAADHDVDYYHTIAATTVRMLLMFVAVGVGYENQIRVAGPTEFQVEACLLSGRRVRKRQSCASRGLQSLHQNLRSGFVSVLSRRPVSGCVCFDEWRGDPGPEPTSMRS